MRQMTLQPYITDVKERYGFKTYPEVMEFLGMQKQAWTKIQNGHGVSDKNAMRIAKVLDINVYEVLAISKACSARTNDEKDVWMKLARYVRDRGQVVSFSQ